MQWIDSFTPKENIKEGDLIKLWFSNIYDTAMVTKSPYKYFYKDNKFFWRIDLDYQGFEAYASWNSIEERWMGKEL